MLITFAIITIVAAMVIAGMLGVEWRRSQLESVEIITEGEFSAMLQNRLDRFYFSFADFFTQFGHHLYYWSLLLMRHLVVGSKILLHRAENKFSRLIDSVRGKGVINKKGAVSLFLAQLRNSK